MIPIVDSLYINGGKIPAGMGAGAPDATVSGEYYRYEDSPLRLGEKDDSGSGKITMLNAPPDATIDDVLIWGGEQTARALDCWSEGRYYRGKAGVYTSPEINLAQEAHLPLDTVVIPCVVAWTQYVPEDLSKAKGKCWVKLTGAEEMTNPSGNPVRSEYDKGPLMTTHPIRYEVHFDPGDDIDPQNTPVIEPLIFDDITIIYYVKPEFKSWAYRR
jgi:hypothetical protein